MINERDREYLNNKYHRTDEPFDAFRRMDYHGYEYPEDSGMSLSDIDKGLGELDKELVGEPHQMHKAKMVKYVLDNTRVDVNEHDWFVGFECWSRPISKYTCNKWHAEVLGRYSEQYNEFLKLDKAGFVYGGLDFDHTVPDWDAIMSLGFSGLLKRLHDRYASLSESVSLTEEQENFYRGAVIEYEAIIAFIDRLYKCALTKKHAKAGKIAACLKNLRDGAPTDIYEAMQLIYIYFMISESVDHYQVRSLGFGLDATLYPFYLADTESGRYTKDEIAELLAYFMIQWQAIGNYWGQPFYLGGTALDGSCKVNELSYLILDVYDKLGLYNPKIQIKVSDSTPKDLIRQALTMIRGGTSSIVFCNEKIITEALMSRGLSYDEACDAVVSGCYEYKSKVKKGVALSGFYFNALKPISLVFDRGFDRVSGEEIGLKTRDVGTMSSFSEFYGAYLAQLDYLVHRTLGLYYELEGENANINPSLLFSATTEQCVGSMTDALGGGIDNSTGTLLCGLGTAVDALMAVYELVFERKITTLAELRDALANNWNGYEHLRRAALACKHKFGNGDELSDLYAATLVREVSAMLSGRRNIRGGRTTLELHSARAFIIHGELTSATPDGRRDGEEMSKNGSPTPGADRCGVTALVKSATKLDHALTNDGSCLDVMLHPTAVSGDDGLVALEGVMSTYMKHGGGSIHFNIFDVQTLRDAQQHPERYENLQVRVCGWNVLWNNMSKVEQDAYILRAENIK
ncbi:MAG: hypothetical protein IJW03_04220 [Clostridia bacterium]|nr:hypothetical protein [Clostridia bacterium]